MSEPGKAVFLSYASQDAEAARRISDALRGFGVEVWFDQNELRGGDAWDAHIHQRIRTCALFIPIISKQCQNRPEGYFRREWSLADERTRDMGRKRAFIIPVCIDDTNAVDADVPDSFVRAHWTQLPDGIPTPGLVSRVVQLLEAPAQKSAPAPAVAHDSPSSPAAPRRKRNPALTIGATAAIVIGVVTAIIVATKKETPSVAPSAQQPLLSHSPSTPPKAVDKSIAVLPFDNRSKLEDDQYFTDGIHDDLHTQISRIRDIKTISRTSVMTYKDTTKNMRTIGGELSVAFLLEGGVQRAGDQIRIDVQLIDAATDAHLWAEIYTRRMTAENIFEIQSEIATAIANELQAVLSPEEAAGLRRMPTENLAALEAFFRGRAAWAENTVEGFEAAIDHYSRAIELDPDFSDASASLARSHLALIWFAGAPESRQVALAEPLIQKAMALDPSSSEASLALAQVHHYQNQPVAAEAAYRRAIELNVNNVDAYTYCANLLSYRPGREREAVALTDEAIVRDPLNLAPRQIKAVALHNDDRVSESRQVLEHILQQDPNYAAALFAMGTLYYENLHRYDEAIRFFRRAVAADPRSTAYVRPLVIQYRELGMEAESCFWIERALALSPRGQESEFLRWMLAMWDLDG